MSVFDFERERVREREREETRRVRAAIIRSARPSDCDYSSSNLSAVFRRRDKCQIVWHTRGVNSAQSYVHNPLPFADKTDSAMGELD